MRPIKEILSENIDALSDQELFERIVYKIKQKYDFQISGEEAHAAARTLTGFYQTLVELKKQLRYNEL